jgi:hypothetical protein
MSTGGRRTAVLITNTSLGATSQTVGEAGMAQQAGLRVLLEPREVCLGPAGEFVHRRQSSPCCCCLHPWYRWAWQADAALCQNPLAVVEESDKVLAASVEVSCST